MRHALIKFCCMISPKIWLVNFTEASAQWVLSLISLPIYIVPHEAFKFWYMFQTAGRYLRVNNITDKLYFSKRMNLPCEDSQYNNKISICLTQYI